jgi:hypothetical protein
MGACRDHNNRWRYRKWITGRDGSRVRIKGTPSLDTKAAAEQAERDHIERALVGEPAEPVAIRSEPKRKEEPLTLRRFVEEIWWPKFRTGGGRRGVNSYATLMEKDTYFRVAHSPGARRASARQPHERGPHGLLRSVARVWLQEEGTRHQLDKKQSGSEETREIRRAEGPREATEGIEREVGEEHPHDAANAIRVRGEVGVPRPYARTAGCRRS